METISRTREVLETKDYSIFKSLKGNREINQNHVQDLVDSFSERPDLVDLEPVKCNEKMEVVDGQHTVEALKTLQWPVAYIVRPGLTIAEAQMFNAMRRPWKLEDYAKSYADEGRPVYIQILAWREQYQLPISVIMEYCMSAENGRGIHPMFKLGKFMIPDLAATERRLRQLFELSNNAPLFWNTSSFARAFLRIGRTHQYDHARMRAQLGDTRLIRLASQREVILDLERIYNLNKKTDIKRFI